MCNISKISDFTGKFMIESSNKNIAFVIQKIIDKHKSILPDKTAIGDKFLYHKFTDGNTITILCENYSIDFKELTDSLTEIEFNYIGELDNFYKNYKEFQKLTFDICLKEGEIKNE